MNSQNHTHDDDGQQQEVGPDGRTPPQDIHAEMSVLGGMLMSRNAIEDVMGLVSASDFYRPAHQVIFEAIMDMYGRDEAVDIITIADYLSRRNARPGVTVLAHIGGQTYLHRVVSAVVTYANAGFYAEIVAERAKLRRVIEAGARLVQMGHAQGDADVEDIVAAARGEVEAILDAEVDDSHEGAVYAALGSLDEPLGTPTPWRDLSRTIVGWAPGMLYVVGARPSVGKTVCAINAVMDMAHRGRRAMLFSLEMSKTELYLRMLSSVSGVDGETLMHRATTKQDDQALAEAASHIARLPLTVDDRSALTLAQIRARIRAEQRRHDVGLVVIDYLTLIKPAGGKDRRVQVDEIAQGLKNMARDLHVPVVALAQLNRNVEGRADKMPTMSDLRESGGIEQAPDGVMLLHRVLLEADGDTSELSMLVVKNRHGPTSLVRMRFDGAHSLIKDQERHVWSA